ncbi:MAG TPA: fibrobacter succinogenes major paralogous domain-containing protein [Bacteroidales bacterium]|nr:fibrobacter succinogenes major paralogous domain-containing protein [Bacteroidales bacterium]
MTLKKASYLFVIAVMAFFAGCSKTDSGTGDITDYEGNTYRTVRIGEQVWMAENLRSTVLNDGTPVTLAADSTTWQTLTGPGYCWYNNDPANKDIYGALYNAYTTDSSRICPAGWHVPSKEEWQVLVTYLGDSLDAGGMLKEAGTLHWNEPNTGADNKSGFSATGAGVRYFQGTFSSELDYTAIWSATATGSAEQWFLGLYYGNTSASFGHRKKTYGFSIRCIRDAE